MRLQTFIPILFFRVSNVALSLLVTFVAVRFLNSQSNELFYTLSVVFVLAPIITLGIPESIVRNNSQPAIIQYSFPLYLVLASPIAAWLASSFLQPLNGVFVFLLTCSLSLSIYYSEKSRVKGRFFIGTFLNNSLFSIFIIFALLIASRSQRVNISLAASFLLPAYIVAVLLIGRTIKIKESGVFNRNYLSISVRLMLATALASLWDNLDIICISAFEIESGEDALPILRLVRGYAFPGIVLGYILAPQLGRIASRRMSFSRLSSYRYVYLLVAIMIVTMAAVFVSFSKEILEVLLGSVSSVGVDWNKAIICIQAVKSLFIPLFIYLNFVKPNISIAIILTLSFFKVFLYYFFQNETLIIYGSMGVLHITLIAAMTLVTYKKLRK